MRWHNNMMHAERLITDRVFMIVCGDGSKIYWNSITKNGTHYILKKLKLTAAADGYHIRDIPVSAWAASTHPFASPTKVRRSPSKGLFSENLTEERKLVVIRNPIDRAISSYQEILKMREDYPPGLVPQLQGREVPPQYITQQTQFYRLKENLQKSFLIFLREISDDMYGFYEPHLFSQKKYITDKGWNIDDFEYVISFDHLGKELEKICNENDIDFIDDKEIKKADMNIGNKEVTRKLKKLCESDVVKELVHKLYADDFRLYEFAKARIAS